MSGDKLNVAPVPRLALSIEEACAALGVSWDMWNEHIAPHVGVVRVGRRKLVPVVELERWLADNADRVADFGAQVASLVRAVGAAG